MPMAYEALWHEYMQMPVVTRAYTTACVITTLAVVSISSVFALRPLPLPLASPRHRLSFSPKSLDLSDLTIFQLC